MYITEIFIFVGGLHRLYDSRNEVSLSFRLSFKHAHWDISRDGGKINSVQSVEASYDFRKQTSACRSFAYTRISLADEGYISSRALESLKD